MARQVRGLAKTLTDAQASTGLVVTLIDPTASHSNWRSIPYAEQYRSATGIMQTPIERLQEAAEQESERKRQRTQEDS